LLSAFLRQEIPTPPSAASLVPSAPSDDILKLGDEDSDAGKFDGQLMEILKRGASNAGSADTDDPLEALMRSVPKLDAENAPPEGDELPPFPHPNDSGAPSFLMPPPASETGSAETPAEQPPSLEDIMGISSLSDLEKQGHEPRPPAFPPIAPENKIPELPEDIKPKPASAPPQDDFLRMFPGAR
jgi:hypothetical protein